MAGGHKALPALTSVSRVLTEGELGRSAALGLLGPRMWGGTRQAEDKALDSGAGEQEAQPACSEVRGADSVVVGSGAVGVKQSITGSFA